MRPGFDSWVGKIPWRGKSNPPQYSCLGDPMDRGAWRAIVHGVTKELDPPYGRSNKWLSFLIYKLFSGSTLTPTGGKRQKDSHRSLCPIDEGLQIVSMRAGNWSVSFTSEVTWWLLHKYFFHGCSSQKTAENSSCKDPER